MKMKNGSKFKQTEIGKSPEPAVAGGWPVLSLREAGVSLIDCEHRTPPASEGGYAYIAIPQIRHGHIDLTRVRHITREHFVEWTRKAHPEPNDVILSRRCNPGETAFVPPGLECAVGQNLVLLRADGKKIFQPFLRWLVRGLEWWEQVGKFINAGAVFDSLKCADIPSFRLPIPPLYEQRGIAHILGTLDGKMELNQQMNRTLEAMGRAIFKRWFIDFEFPNEEGKPYKSSGGEVVHNEALAKEIPKGWQVGKLGEYTAVVKGCSYRRDDLKESEIALVTLKSIDRGGGFNQDGYKEYVGEFNEDQVVKDGEIVVAQTDLTQKAEVIGTPAIVNSLGKYSKLVASLDLQIVRPKNSLSTNYLYHLLGTEDFHNHALSYTNGTTVLHLNKNALPEFVSIIPPKEILIKFDKIDDSLSAKRTLSETETQTLSHLRDFLLPKLMSGKIRVPIEAR
jgi:type I restriction enzyme S subunit